MTTEKPFYSINELAAYLGVSRSFLYLERAKNRIVFHKLSSKTVITRESLNDYLSNRLQEATTVMKVRA